MTPTKNKPSPLVKVSEASVLAGVSPETYRRGLLTSAKHPKPVRDSPLTFRRIEIERFLGLSE
jgi:hypothetical protein